jgi:hypothetical protein
VEEAKIKNTFYGLVIFYRVLLIPVIVHREQSVKREKKPTRCNNQMFFYQLLSQHVSGIIMPIFRSTKNPLLHLVYCSVSAGCGW